MNEQQLRYIHAIEKEESIQKASSSLGKRGGIMREGIWKGRTAGRKGGHNHGVK